MILAGLEPAHRKRLANVMVFSPHVIFLDRNFGHVLCAEASQKDDIPGVSLPRAVQDRGTRERETHRWVLRLCRAVVHSPPWTKLHGSCLVSESKVPTKPQL